MANLEQDTTETESFAGMLPRVKGGIRDYWRELRLFSKNVRLYLIGLFLIWVNFQIFQLLFNLYLKELGYGEGAIGWVNSSRGVGMSIMAIPAAIIISRIRLKPILMIACSLLAVSSFFMATMSPLFLILSFSIFSGMMLAIFRVAAGPFFMRNSTPVERTLVFATSYGVNVLAGMAASAGSGEIVTMIGGAMGDIISGYRYTLYIGIALSSLAFIPLAMIRASEPSSEENRLILSRAQLRRRGGFYFKIAVVNFIVGTGAGLIIPFLNLYFSDRFSLEPDAIGWLFFAVTAAMLIGGFAGPALTKKFGLIRTVVVTQLLSIPFMFILSYSYFLPLVVAAFIIRGGLMNLGTPIVTNFAMELSDRREQGLVNALLMLSWTSSWMVSTAVGGSMIEAYGYTTTLNITMILYLFSAVMYYYLFRNHEERRETGGGYYLVTEKSL